LNPGVGRENWEKAPDYCEMMPPGFKGPLKGLRRNQRKVASLLR